MPNDMLTTLEKVRGLGWWCVDLRGRKVSWSDKTALLHGERSGFAPRSLHALMRLFPQGERRTLWTTVVQAARMGTSFAISTNVLHNSGRISPVHLCGDCTVESGVIVKVQGFIEDASEIINRQKARESAERAAFSLRNAAHELDDGIVLFDGDDRLVFCNARYREMYSISAPAIRIGATFESIVRYGVAHGQYEDAIGCEEAWVAERMRLHRDEPERLLEQSLPDGRILRVRESRTPDGGRVGFRIDVTAEKMLERKLASALMEARANGQLHASLLPNLAHEMRTPLNAIVGFSQMIEYLNDCNTEMRGKISEYAQDIAAAGRHLGAIVDNLMTIAAIDRNGEALCAESGSLVDVKDVIEQACKICTLAARDRSKRLDVFLPDQPVAIHADRTRLVQVLLNFITNAIKYSPYGGAVEIAVDLSARGTVEIRVTDDGEGVPEHLQSRLFDRYDRLSADRTSVRGSGLGLAIAKEFTEAMGGRTMVTNDPRGGAAFSVIFPRAEAQQEAFPDIDARRCAG